MTAFIAGLLFQAFGLLIGFVVFVLGSFALDLRRSNPHSIFETRTAARVGLTPYPGLSFLLLILGMLFLYFGSRLLVNGAMAMALNFGVSQSAVGLTMMAVGSSLPELATTIVASLRRQTGIAIGNIIGSNIFNLLGVVGITAAVQPIAVSAMVAHADALIMLAAAVLLGRAPTAAWADDGQADLHRAYYLQHEEKKYEAAAALYARLAEGGDTPAAVRDTARRELDRCRAALLTADPARLMPAETLAYVEIRNPGGQIERLVEMLGLLGSPTASGQRPADAVDRLTSDAP